jgi:ElaB/YqjD/DUF883 family membrane-anchored ribosome-binding protein
MDSCSSLTQENSALKCEVEQLHVEIEKLQSSESDCSEKQIEKLQTEVEKSRQARKATARALKKAFVRSSTRLMKMLDLIQSKFGIALGHLDMQIRNLKEQIPLLRVIQSAESDQTSDSEDFMVQLAYGIKSIERLSHEYANSSTLKVKYEN